MTIKRALIVDDSSTAQYRLKKMLRHYPLDIDIVDSGEAALRYLSRHSPAVIFMDHLMPGMDGLRALQIIKSNPDTATVPVIMYTSKSGDLYTGQARALGALDVVSKDRINATDLSKVMQNIHIYPTSSPDETIESAELIAAANQVTASASDGTDAAVPPLDRRASSLEQARNLELRLSHMEHSLEDNRRFITSRVVRELQGLRQNLRKELGDIMLQQPVAVAPPALLPTDVQPSTTTSSSGWTFAGILLALISLVAIAYFLLQINDQLNQSEAQQATLNAQLEKVTEQINKEPEMISPALLNANMQQPIKTTVATDSHFLDDLAWTFNQNGALAFHQSTIDPQPVLRLHELLHRLASNAFTGTATITIYVGDFCVAVDNMGMVQLAPPEKTLGDCMLSSEIYTLERLMDDYAREVEMILSNLTRDVNSTLKINVNAVPGPEIYPDRIPTVSARNWNTLAQNNNRLELALTLDE